MVATTLYIIISVVIVSLVSLVGVLSLTLSQKFLGSILLVLVSISAGTLFGGAILHLLPEAVAELGFTLQVSLLVLAGIITFFILESLIHQHQCDTNISEHVTAHKNQNHLHEQHKHHIGVLNLVGDGVHNFVDGLIIAGSYLVSIPVGIATTLAVILHEVPQELADFGVLVYSGFSKKKALLLNFFSAAISILGAIVGLVLGTKGEGFATLILPFAAGGFIYIAGANLIPELHKHCGWKNSFYHFLAFLGGILLMVGLLYI